jgi:hypothetical protein
MIVSYLALPLIYHGDRRPSRSPKYERIIYLNYSNEKAPLYTTFVNFRNYHYTNTPEILQCFCVLAKDTFLSLKGYLIELGLLELLDIASSQLRRGIYTKPK